VKGLRGRKPPSPEYKIARDKVFFTSVGITCGALSMMYLISGCFPYSIIISLSGCLIMIVAIMRMRRLKGLE